MKMRMTKLLKRVPIFISPTVGSLFPSNCSQYQSLASISPSPPPWRTIAHSVDADLADVTDEAHILCSNSVLKPAMIPTLLQPRVVVYDGVCHLCHRGVKWLIQADKFKKLKFCCLQSEAAEPYLRLCGLDREDVLRRFLFVEGLGSYHQGSTAALRVISYLPLPYSSLSTLMVIPTPLRDAVYDYVAKNRYQWFGRGEDCLVLQEKEMLERFIDRDEMLGRNQSDL